MRISKPSSVNNSPGSSSTMANRRRTMVGVDAWTPRKQQQVWDYLSTPQQVEPPSRSQPARPVSWHPSSYFHLSQQTFHGQQPQATYPLATPSMYGGPGHTDFYSHLAQVSPIMTSYSSNTSPSSTFSPLPLPSSDNGQLVHADRWCMHRKYGEGSSQGEVQAMAEPFLPPNNSASPKVPSITGELDWNSFVLQGFNTTTPPTPETFLQLQQPAVSETAVPFEPLDEPEEEGEILVGMGLYDTPDKFDEDPQLNNYRSTVSSLLGSTLRPTEAKGKGLKLEETWEPPKPEEEEEEEEEDDDDEEAEDDE